MTNRVITRRSVEVRAFVTPPVKERIRQAAQVDGVSVGEFIRRAIDSDLNDPDNAERRAKRLAEEN